MNTKSIPYMNLYKYVKDTSNNKYNLSTTWSNPIYCGRGADDKGGRYCIIDNERFNNGDRKYIVFTSTTLKAIKKWVDDKIVIE